MFWTGGVRLCDEAVIGVTTGGCFILALSEELIVRLDPQEETIKLACRYSTQGKKIPVYSEFAM
jgi:hypothetical protein